MTTVPYTVTVQWGGLNVTLDTSKAQKAQAQASGANAGAMTLNFATQATTLPVPQGTYSDIVTVKVGAPI